MQQTQYHLLKTRRFLPLFITQFLNAFNDNVFKNALVILITYKIAHSISYEQLMIVLSGGIFTLPFFIFSATAGQIADKFEKSRLIRIIKFFEIIIMLLAAIGFYLNNIFLLLFALFLAGTHSAFFGPLKYAILPDHLFKDELLGGNALIEAGTFIAILVGSILGGVFILTSYGIFFISITIITIAFAGWLSSFFIPQTEIGQFNLKINFNIFKQSWKIIQSARAQKTIYAAILGISWFWLVGATFLTQFPSFTKNILHANAHIVTLFFTLFSLGIATGSLICNKLLHGEISAKYAPLGLLGMSLFTFDIYFSTKSQNLYTTNYVLGIPDFLQSFHLLRILADVFLLSACSGIFVVPLYTIIQELAHEAERARIIACNNILNSLFMVFSALGIIALLALHFTITQLFLTIAIINLFVALYLRKLQ
jgi:acyl-[acyl-carrier-protein]-phospholipid O-acyltransferase/long-chain-fatty-acid--[acyl-carrier-protein] ligase